MLVCGPGHGGPAIVANAYLEGTYSERYPSITRDYDGLCRLFKQFSWPRGIPSHVSPDCPGSMHEGGELGYGLLHAYGAALDNEDLIVCCVVGDGEAEVRARPAASRGCAPAPAHARARSRRGPRRRARARPRGTRTSSSTRGGTAAYCPCSTSTAPRSEARRCSRGCRARSSRRCWPGTGTSPSLSRAQSPPRCTS